MTKPAIKAIVMGASAGAFEALSTVLSKLPKNYPHPIIIVVHIPNDQKSLLPELLQQHCAIAVKEAEDKEDLRPSTAYIAPPDYHLLVESHHYLSLSSEEPQLYSRPSIDILFESAADAYGTELLGIILSGANEDGSAGLKAILAAGGTGLIQTPKSAYATAMPLAAMKACPKAQCLKPDQIASYLQEI